MKPEPFIDSSVFIIAKERPQSNSAKIMELLAGREIEAVVSAKVVREVFAYFKGHYGKDIASDYRLFIMQACRIIEPYTIEKELAQWKNRIKEKDLEHIATAKAVHAKFLVGFDRHFKPFPEYRTPKKFLKEIGIKERRTEY
ncbi:MAG: PIN domain-containing protein [Candidatus Diapherotrites archaeon]|nr:PIN domain-containing protein [Candidatus Diapherotrites archaeon]